MQGERTGVCRYIQTFFRKRREKIHTIPSVTGSDIQIINEPEEKRPG